ncbi:MAG TPA: hypothetical protein VEO74_14700, partial [Thermoanaerobaculia bacterium]|nr:hypothetical protein [Thermoanaerobaculia bacterium]
MMRRLAAAFLVALALGIVARPLLRAEVFTFRDHTDYFQPLRFFTATQIKTGHLPLWNPYSASGEPWLANPQTGVFYPPAWLFLVLPFEAAYMLYLALHLALLGCGALLLFSRKASLGAALIGAVALMFCGPTLSLLDVQNNLTTFAWLPLVIWCAVSRASAMWSAAAIAMSFLAGEPFFAAAGALIFAIVRRRGVLDVAAQSFALAGVQLLPFLAMLRGSDRVGSSTSDLRDSMPLHDWLRVAVPPSLTSGGYDPRLGQHFIPIVYVGVITCALAAVGLIFAWRRVGAWLALLVAAMVIAAAPVAALLMHLPLTLFRYPARLVPLGALAIVAIAVEGWDVLASFAPHPAFGHPLPASRGEGPPAPRSFSPLAGRRWRDAPDEGRHPPSLAILVAIAIFVELVAFARPLLVTAPIDWKHQVPYDGSVGRDAKIIRLGDPALVALNRRRWISGYLNLYEHRFDAWTAAPVVSRRYAELYERAMRDRSPALLSSMSAGYVLARRGNDVVAYRNPAARPLASAGKVTPSLLAMGTTFVHAVIDLPAPSMMIV